jgi:arsenical-resistance protein 2
MILEGGIKGWVAAGQEYIDCMDGFDEEAWSKEKLDQ